jgi:CHASE2 domain-containing sensor protein
VRWAARNRFAPLAGLLIALITAGGWIALHAAGALTVLELDSVDARAPVRSHPPPKDVAFVAVDAKSQNDLRQRWPFDRS